MSKLPCDDQRTKLLADERLAEIREYPPLATVVSIGGRREPRVTPDHFTIWVVRTDGPTKSYSVWRGSRTVAALSELLATLDANGFPGTLQLESASCGPVEMTISELVDLGIVREEFPITKARAFFRRLVKQTRHRGSV